MTPPIVSVVIPTYQRCASVRRALRALETQTLPAATYEVIVVVDGSTDGTAEMLEAERPQFILRAQHVPNRGRASACNTGIRMARAGIVILLDDDMEAEPQLLQAHLHAHQAASPLGVIGAAPIVMDAKVSPTQRYLATKFNEHLERLSSPGYELKLRDVYSGNFSIRRQVLLDIGGFDEQFRLYGNEDLELAVRLQEAAVRLVFQPDARARQYSVKDFRGVARDHIAKGKTSVQLAAKHPHARSELRLAQKAAGPRWWHVARASLLGASRVFPQAPELLIRTVQRAEAYAWLPLARVYPRALDYFYWLGVARALEEQSTPRPDPTSRPQELQA